MKRRILAFASLLIVLTAAGLAAASPPTPREVLDASDRARGKLPGVVWTVDMASIEQTKETRQVLEVKATGDNALAQVLEPLRSKGQMFLFVGRNMWFIKPGVSKPVPISPRQKMIGQAANGDIASTNYAGDYEGVFQAEEAVAGEPCYVIELSARNKNVTYDRIVYWVSKKRVVGVKADFYTVSGKKLKSATFDYGNTVAHQGEKMPFVSRMVITDAVRPEDVTTLEYSKITVKPLPDATFNLNLLAR
jgi:hypothetical protein